MSAFSLCPKCGDLVTWTNSVPGKIKQCFKCKAKINLIVTHDEAAARLLSKNIKEGKNENHQN